MHQFSTIRGEYRSWIQRTSLKELSTTQPSSSYHLVDEFKLLPYLMSLNTLGET